MWIVDTGRTRKGDRITIEKQKQFPDIDSYELDVRGTMPISLFNLISKVTN